MTEGDALREGAHLVGLVVVDRQPVALAVARPRWMSWPSTSTRPAVGALLPVMSSNSVVLPEPFGPMTPTMPASGKAKSASSENVGRRTSAPRL